MPPRLEVELKDYELTDIVLGKGSFAKVFLGLSKESNEKVAVKVIKRSTTPPKLITNEILSVNILINNPHENIISYKKIIKDDDYVYIIMEYCPDGSINDLLKSALKETYAHYYFSQLLRAVMHLRKLNLFHGDIKPNNILLTNDKKNIKLIDFSLSHLGTTKIISCGSPLFMAPEIINRDTQNNSSDIWSLGVLLYKMIFGVYLYSDKKCKTKEDFKKLINSDDITLPPQSKTHIEISKECKELIKSMLQHNISNRISWDRLFKDPWVNKYEYIDSPHSEDGEAAHEEEDDKCIFSLEL